MGVAAGSLWLCPAADAQDRCEAVRLRGHDPGRNPGLFPACAVLCRSAVRTVPGSGPRRRQRPESAAPVPGDGDSSSHALPGLRGLLGSFRLCAGSADDALPRREMDQGHARLDHGDLAVFDRRHLPGHALGLRRAGLGRLLGLGSGGERQLHALADRNRLSPLRDDAGEEGHDEELERLAHLLHLPAHPARHVAHSRRISQFRARLRAILHRHLVRCLHGHRARGLHLHLRAAAQSSQERASSRVAGQPRIQLPLQQSRPPHRLLRHSLGNALPHPLGIRSRQQGHRRRSVL